MLPSLGLPMAKLYSDSGSAVSPLGRFELRNATYWLFVTSYVPMLYE